MSYPIKIPHNKRKKLYDEDLKIKDVWLRNQSFQFIIFFMYLFAHVHIENFGESKNEMSASILHSLLSYFLSD